MFRIEDFLRLKICVALACCLTPCFAQNTETPNTAADDALLDRMIAANVLTTPGAPPFHAILEISSEDSSTTKHQGRVELFWAAPTSYFLKLESPEFHQTLIVSGDQVQESDAGDFYPGWLQNFVGALLNPIAREHDLRGHQNAFTDDPHYATYCVKRDDRHNGITGDLTFAQVCYEKALGTNIAYTLDFTHYLGLENFNSFHKKSIAHTYHVSTRDHTDLQGALTTLEDWKPVDSQLTITNPTPPLGRILTSIVSTAKEESLLQSAPKDIHWPPVREGKLDGYLIVHAITDRTGQVREAAQYNSDDNQELAAFGRQIALQYKFNQLLVDGAPQQMEMPLVLHFKTTLGVPIPELSDSESRKVISGCDLSRKINAKSTAGQQIEISLNIEENGHLDSIRSITPQLPVLPIFQFFMQCKYAIYKQDGKPIPYHANITMSAK